MRSITPALEAFHINMKRVTDVIAFRQVTFDRLANALKSLEPFDPRIAADPHENADYQKVLNEYTSVEHHFASILEWVPVMLVTYTEAYLKDALAYLADADSSL